MINLTLLENALQANYKRKKFISYAADAIFVFCSFWLAYFLRLDDISAVFVLSNWLLVLALIPVTLCVFNKLGLYRIVLRYMGSKALETIVASTAISMFALIFMCYFTAFYEPRTLPLIYFGILAMCAGGSRLIVHITLSRIASRNRRKVVIYGAGAAGRQLANGLKNGSDYGVAAFLDDDHTKCNSIIQGVPVISPTELSAFIDKNAVEKILVAIPSASIAERSRVLHILEPFEIKIQTIPTIENLLDGKVSPSDLVDVELEDLLGRDPVDPIPELLHKNIGAKVILVTGAGGSIGSELCRQIIQLKPAALILFELSEFALYEIETELADLIKTQELTTQLYPIVGSVQHAERVESVIRTFKVNTIYHAAAYKHVPMVEHNVVEGVRNNIFGTLAIAKAAIKAKVETFVLISTDKAVRPTNVMGASKRMAELILQALDRSPFNHSTRFSMVRFGNVLGSSGSVVPLFRKQIREGKAITLTHAEITRYFMTIPEASQLVIQAGAMAKGGDVFVLDMGQPVKIKELAERLIRLSGLTIKSEQNPHGDIELVYTGLRPGEKLYEELLIGDNVTPTEHERILAANELSVNWKEIEGILNKLEQYCCDFNHTALRATLMEAPLGFNPVDTINDLEWLARQNAMPMPFNDSNKNVIAFNDILAQKYPKPKIVHSH